MALNLLSPFLGDFSFTRCLSFREINKRRFKAFEFHRLRQVDAFFLWVASNRSCVVTQKPFPVKSPG